MGNIDLQSAAIEGFSPVETGGSGADLVTSQIKARAKHLNFVLAPNNGAAPVLMAGIAGGGENGQGSGRDGSGRKKQSGVEFVAVSSAVTPEAKTGGADPENAEDMPLRLFAQERGLEYVAPKGYEEKLDGFTEYKWQPRIDTIVELKKAFETDRRRVLYMAQELLTLKIIHQNNISHVRRKSRRLNQYNKFVEAVKNMLGILSNLTYARFVTREIKALKSLLLSRITSSRVDESLEENILEDCNLFLGFYRYIVEFRKETYRSRAFTTESFAEFLKAGSVYEAFYHRYGLMKTVGDFGSGCAENMIQLSDGVKEAYIAKRKHEIEEFTNENRPDLYKKVLMERYENPDKYPDKKSIDHEVQRRVNEILPEELKEDATINDLPSVVQSKFICMDQSDAAVDRARVKKLTGMRADISADWEEFEKHPPDPKACKEEFEKRAHLKPGKLDIALTSLTFDRAWSKKNLARNMAFALAEGGTAVFALNPEYTTENDGDSGNERPINYGTVGDWDLTSHNEVEYMQKLLPLLKGVGLTPVRLGRHKCRVISSDCQTDPLEDDYGPQEYNMLVVVCKKETSAKKDATPVEEPSAPGV